MLNTFTWAYFLSLMGLQHAERGFWRGKYWLSTVLLKVNPAGHFIRAQFHGTNSDFKGLTAVGSGNCNGRSTSLLLLWKIQIAKPWFKLLMLADPPKFTSCHVLRPYLLIRCMKRGSVKIQQSILEKGDNLTAQRNINMSFRFICSNSTLSARQCPCN